jgi:hypothetical protein
MKKAGINPRFIITANACTSTSVVRFRRKAEEQSCFPYTVL